MHVQDNRKDSRLVDVSAHQPAIRWSSLAATGFVGAFLKASEGVGFEDAAFARHREAASAAGLATGAYHFARPDTVTSRNDALDEAEWFLHVAQPRAGDLRPALDLETPGLPPAELAAWALTWLQRVERATGERALVYTYPSFYAERLGPYGRVLAQHSLLWLASWGANDGRPHPAAPLGAWPRITLHQYTSRGSGGGVVGSLDLNRLGAGVTLRGLRLGSGRRPSAQSPTRR